MRCLILAVMFFTPFGLTGQQPAPPEGSNWQHVQALPSGTSVYVNDNHRTTNCKLTAVDADTLTCTHRKAITFQRTDIASVKIPRRTRSTLIMAGIGAGVGVVVVKGVAATLFSDATNGKAKGSVYAGGAGIGAVFFGPIGYFGDPTRSTVYKVK